MPKTILKEENNEFDEFDSRRAGKENKSRGSNGKRSSKAALDAIEKVEGDVHSFVTVTKEQCIERCRGSTEKIDEES